MERKNKLIILGIILLAVTIAIFLLFIFKDKKTTVISNGEEKKNLPAEEMVGNNDSEVSKEESPEIVSEKNTEKNTIPEEKPAVPKEEVVSNFKIIKKLVAWGFQKADSRGIDTIIIHSSYNALGGDEYDTDKLIAEYKEYEVSPHYLIDRSGKVYKLVEEKNIAYHAGESKVPDGRKNVNGFSLGIEVMENKIDGPSSAQYAALKKLIGDIKSRHKIKYVLGHNQIAPGRKDDPWKFDWKKI
jgi:N-acetyl-anhydromuramyl-L-alanine amidase AmpD